MQDIVFLILSLKNGRILSLLNFELGIAKHFL